MSLLSARDACHMMKSFISNSDMAPFYWQKFCQQHGKGYWLCQEQDWVLWFYNDAFFSCYISISSKQHKLSTVTYMSSSSRVLLLYWKSTSENDENRSRNRVIVLEFYSCMFPSHGVMSELKCCSVRNLLQWTLESRVLSEFMLHELNIVWDEISGDMGIRVWKVKVNTQKIINIL
jgi:hypothetical protein